MKIILVTFILMLILIPAKAQLQSIPGSYTNIHYDENGRLYFEKDRLKFYADTSVPKYGDRLDIKCQSKN